MAKLLLIQDVEDLGRCGDLVNVKPGYARNFLIPQQLAILADKRTLKIQARLQEERQQKAAVDKSESEALAQKLEGATIEIQVKVDHEGHMYGSVNQADIIRLLQEQHSVELEKKNILLKHPIKEVGVSEIELKLKEGVRASVTLKTVPENTHGYSKA
ncbi:50S ribosomal protein L9 [Chlamydiales bacterium STE3]|nr:50S ribosomal protein L9 [Chlamydiales bacterium STE3]